MLYVHAHIVLGQYLCWSNANMRLRVLESHPSCLVTNVAYRNYFLWAAMEVINCKLMGDRTHGRHLRLRCYASVLLGLLLGAAAGALETVESAPNPYNVTSFVIFGDSTLDVGNNNYLLSVVKSDFPPYGRDFPGGLATGRFCNGQIAADFIGKHCFSTACMNSIQKLNSWSVTNLQTIWQ